MIKRILILATAASVAGALHGCDSQAAPDPSSGAAQAEVSSLPLTRGFYVRSETPCGEASNATLTLLHREGLNSSREPCTFKSIEPLGGNRYRVAEECSSGGAAWGHEETVETNSVVWTILSPTAFLRESEHGWSMESRHCPQASLPESWRDNDISDLID